MKIQEDELKSRIALLTAEREMEKAKAVDELYKTSKYSKRGIQAESKPVHSDEARNSFPPDKEPQAESNFKNGDFKRVGRNYSKSVLNLGAQPWDPGPPQNTIVPGDSTGSQQLQEILTRCGATDSGKKNVCLRIVPVIVKGKGQHNTIVANVLLDHG